MIRQVKPGPARLLIIYGERMATMAVRTNSNARTAPLAELAEHIR
jgi:hypothetical protein